MSEPVPGEGVEKRLDLLDERTTLVGVRGLIGASLCDPAGARVGQVDDLIVRLAYGPYPPVSGLRARLAGKIIFVPISHVGSVDSSEVRLAQSMVSLVKFERRPGEVLLDDDVLGRRLIDVSAGRLVHANDIAVAHVDGAWRVVGVDPRSHGLLARIIGFLRKPRKINRYHLVDWVQVEAFTGHVPTARLLMPLRRLRRLHPAQIADLVEGASHQEGAEIIQAVSDDPDLEADVFEELDPEHQREFIEDRSDEETAELLDEMDPDDAADLINEIEQERRLSILELLPAEKQLAIRRLLEHHPDTAGGLMSTDVVMVADDASVQTALAALQSFKDLSTPAGSVIVLNDGEGRLTGSIALADLVRSSPDAPAVDAGRVVAARLHLTTDLSDVALMMTDYNLPALPVVDADNKVVGIVTVDDLLEAMVPDEWRRRRGDSDD